MIGPTRRRLTVAAVTAAVLMSGVGCGNRSSEEDIARAAARLGSEASVAQSTLDPGAGAAPAPRPEPEPEPGIIAPGTSSGAPPGATDSSTTGRRRSSGTSLPAAAAAPARAAAGTAPAAAVPGAKPDLPGGSRGPSPAPAGTPARPGTPGCAGAKPEVVIGTVGTQSGPVGVATNPGVKAVQAWVANQNAKGGIDCHPVRYVVADDGGDPARHLALVKQLVEGQHVIGFVFMNAVLSGQASVRYLNDKQVPVMADDGGGDWFNSPMHFPASSSGHGIADLTMAAGARVTVPAGLKKLAVIVCQEASVCATYTDHWSKNGARLGYDIVYRGQASLGQPDYTSQCLAAQSAGAQVMMIAFEPNSVRRLRSSCTKVGFTAPIVLVSVMSTVDMADDPAFEGTVISMPTLPWFLADRPAVAEYQATLRRVAPNLPIDQSTIVGWTAAKLFERAATGQLSEQPSSADLLKGLWSIKGDDLGGLTYPLRFEQGKAPGNGQPCGWAIVIKAKDHTSDGQRFCDTGAATYTMGR
jgi:branched-chain amino acid transport system substrate-binding protein